MEIRKLFHRNEKLQIGKLITLEQARKCEKDKKYADYIFPVEEIVNGKVMCRPQRKENAINLNKNRRSASFDEYVIAGGKYKGINRKGKPTQANMKQYNNWQSAKRYNPEEYVK